jgi:CHAT domain-containing protein
VFPVDDFLPQLKDESERYLNIDPQTALRLGQTLVQESGALGLPEHAALGLLAVGDAYRALGRNEDAVVAMEDAGRIFLAHGNEVGWARSRIGWIVASHRLGHGEAALAVVERAREIFVRHENRYRAATLDLNAGWICYEMGDYDAALAHYDRALAIYQSLGPLGETRAALVKMNQAILLTDLGDFQRALELHEETRQVYLRHGETVSANKQEHNVAFVYAAQGQYTRALHHYGQVSEAHERAGIEISAAWVAVDMVECYLTLNHLDEALTLSEETIARFERCGAPTEAAKARFLCALAQQRLGNSARAQSLLAEADEAFMAAGMAIHSGLVTLQRALLHLGDEDWRAARSAAERARALFAERGLAIREAQANLALAQAAIGLGDEQAAMHRARAVLLVATQRDVQWLAHEAQHILGRVAERRGDLRAALDAYERAVTSIEQMQSALAVELRANYLDDKRRVYGDAIAASLRIGMPERAFAYLERAKSRALVDYLASNLEVRARAPDGGNPDLLDALARLRQEHNWFYNRLYRYGLVEREDGGPTLSDDALRAAIREREKQIARLLERVALDRTEGLPLGVAQITAENAIPRLDADTALLEYFLDTESAVAFVVTAGGLDAVPLAARPREIQRLLQQWQLNLAMAARTAAAGGTLDGLVRNARGILAALYHALIAPTAAHLAGYERLVVVPYGVTHAVPFQALFDGERHLIEAVEVSVSPSSSLLRLAAARPRHTGRNLLIVAHSDGGRLPAVLEEARAVGALFPATVYVERDATRENLIAAAPRHTVLHLAAHGEARLDNPAFAHLQLADGQLSVVDTFNLRLDGALVTLSACETGRSVVTGGDELIGLSRGFLYAGASTLVQSLWRVEDTATARLMAAFYRGLRAGARKGAALRAAQRALYADAAHPYFWGAFQVIGDSGPLSSGAAVGAGGTSDGDG